MNSLYFKSDISELNDVLSVEMVNYFRNRKKLFDEEKVEKLKKSLKAFTGYAFSSNLWEKKYKETLSKEFVPVLKISNIKDEINNYKGFDYINVDSLSASIDKLTVLEKNDIVIAMSGSTVGKMGIIKSTKKCFVNQRVLVLRVKEDVELLSEYLKMLIEVCTEDIVARATGLGLKNINKNDYLNYKAYIPSIQEQKSTIPKVNYRISQLNKTIKLLKDKKKKYKVDQIMNRVFHKEFGIDYPNIYDFTKSFTFSKKIDKLNEKLSIHANVGDLSYLNITKNKRNITTIQKLLDKNLIKDIQDGSHQHSPKNSDLEHKGYNYIMVSNISPLGVEMESVKKVNENFYNKVNQGYIENNDVLLSVMGSVGISCVYKSNEPAIINVALMYLRLNSDKIDPKYISYWFNSIFFNYQIMIDKTNMSRDQISLQKLLRTKILLPSIQKQKEIVRKIDYEIANKPNYYKKIKFIKNKIKKDLYRYVLKGYNENLFKIDMIGGE